MSTVRFSWLVAVVGSALFGGCSSGQPAATGDGGAGPVPVSTAAPGDAASGAATAGAPASTTTDKTAPVPAGAPAAVPAPVVPEKSKEPEKPAEKEAPPPPERIEVNMESLVAGLQSTAATQVFTAGEYFRQIPPGQRQGVLLELSKHADPNVRGNAWRVYTTVATKADLATLSEALQSPFGDVRVAALETLARLPNEQTVGLLAKLLENPDYRELATGLLSKIGPACESAVLPYAGHADARIRRAAWDVLVHAGSRKSIQALEQLSTLPQYQKDEALKRSLDELRERLRKY